VGTPADSLDADGVDHGWYHALRMTRREMLQRLGLIIAATSSLPIPTRTQARTQGLAAVQNALLSLTPAEVETLRAIIARLIPADENGLGALEARADRFIDRALAGALKNQRAAYAEGLAAVEAYAQSNKGAAFSKLSPADQDTVLAAIQINSPQFFNLVRAHTIQGTFSDPFYGGNENFIGWDLIGYPGTRIAVSASLQRMDIKPESSRKSAYDYGMFNKAEF
jgi:gluconate 2-dehydrogenase gamma chain